MLQYFIIREGHLDFEYQRGNLRIEPKNPCSFPITFHSRISKSVTGKIIFANQREEGAQSAEVLVFNLVSSITGRVAKQPTEKVEGQLYQLTQKMLTITNEFGDDGNF